MKAMPKLSLIASCLLLLTASQVRAGETPKAGDPAPAFEGKDQDGKTWKLSDFVGHKNLILYFYPKDNTPGCTKEACGLRDRLTDLAKQDVAVVGVSLDPADSHKKFIADYNLNFTLLADTDSRITDLFGAQMKARKLSRRVSFLIDKQGKIVHVTDNMNAEIQLSEMKQAVAALTGK